MDLDQIFSFLKENNLVAGGIAVTVTGVIFTYVKELPRKLFEAAQRYFRTYLMTSVEIEEDGIMFNWVRIWLHKHFKVKRNFLGYATHSQLDEDDRPKIMVLPGSGSHIGFYKNALMWVTYKRAEQSNPGEVGAKFFKGDIYTITFMTWDASIVTSFLKECRELAIPTDSKIEIRMASGNYYENGWPTFDRIQARSLDSVIIADDAQYKLLDDIKNFLSDSQRYFDLGIPYRRGYLLYGPPGNGKCLGRGTPILMFSGEVKNVEDVKVGDLLMGPDSQSRLVTSVCRGREKLYRVIPTKGDSWVCNESHILSLKESGIRVHKARRHRDAVYRHGGVVNMSIADYLRLKDYQKVHYKLWRTSVEFETKETSIDPYVLGVWLGDGTSSKPEFTLNNNDSQVIAACAYFASKINVEWRVKENYGGCTRYSMAQERVGVSRYQPNPFTAGLRQYDLIENKHIPFDYKCNDTETRLQLLAGLLDSDGHLTGANNFDFVASNLQLAKDVEFLARSLGFAAYMRPCRKSCIHNGTKREGNYFRMSISGDIDRIPTRLTRKRARSRRQVKSPLVTGFNLEELDEGDYFGFTLEGPDRLFLLGDFTVTHNTSLIMALAGQLKRHLYVVSLASGGLDDAKLFRLMSTVSPNSIVLLEDIDCVFVDRKRAIDDKDSKVTFSGLLNVLDGVFAKEGRVLFMTTNHLEKLDPALIRPGRIDYRLEVTNATRKQAIAMHERFFPGRPIAPEVVALDDYQQPMAKVQEMLIHRMMTGEPLPEVFGTDTVATLPNPERFVDLVL